MGLKARRTFIVVLFLVVSWVAVISLQSHLDPNKRKSEEEKEDARWIATSKWWLDRQACRYVGLCGIAHWHPDPAAKPWRLRKNNHNPEPALEPEQESGPELKARDDTFDKKFTGWGDDVDPWRKMRPEDWYGDERVLRKTPRYVLDHAPLVHLYSKEEFWPADPSEHIQHISPHLNYTLLRNQTTTIHNVHQLNDGNRGKDLFLKSLEDVEDRPDWLHSAYNIPVPYDDEEEYVDEEEDPESNGIEFGDEDVTTEEDYKTWFDPFGPGPKHDIAEPQPPKQAPAKAPFKTELRRRRKQRSEPQPSKERPGGYSGAPATLIMVDKGHGIVDAFWFFFYSYNLGTTVLNIRFGNHVGDWEHCLIRFHHGVPKAAFFSAHSGGTSFAYEALEKGKGPGREGRPVFYSAVGSHAMYAMPGTHPYVLPWGLLADVTDKGPLWDPAQNYHAFFLNMSVTHDVDSRKAEASAVQLPEDAMKETFQPAADNPDCPTGWFWYNGHWGDKFYTLRDWRQWRFARQYHYVNGPLGPRYKNLGRSKVCGNSGTCKMLASIAEGKRASWLGKRFALPAR